MMAELSRQVITVTFNPETLTFAPIDLIFVPQGIGMIVINLQTFPESEVGPALFQTDPVQWLHPDNGSPMLTPHMFTVQRIGDRTITILDFNSAQAETPHLFNLVVVYNGNTYGSDPTIINQPPDI